MKIIELNHWFVIDNELSISLKKFFVRINILKNDKFIFYKMTINNETQEELVFNFYSLEDAILFTEKVVANSNSNNEIVNYYYDMFNNKQFASLESSNKEEKMTLTQEELNKAIIEYYFGECNDRVYVTEELTNNDGKLGIIFYLVERNNNSKIPLTEEDLKNVLNNYINSDDYELISFKYIGGIHNVGYFFEKDTPYFGGIELRVKMKEKKLLRKPSKMENNK
jgi:hypothetical protein